MIVALVFLVVALVVFFDFVQPAYTDLQASKGKQISQASFLDNEKKIVSEVQGLVSTYQSETQGEQAVSLALPVGQDLSGALAQVYGLAAANNIGVQNIAISIQAVQVATSQAGSTVQANGQIAAAASVGAIIKPFNSILFQITCAGTYENFKIFLKGLETNIRIFDVKSITLHAASGASNANVKGGPGADYFQYDMTVAAYYQSS